MWTPHYVDCSVDSCPNKFFWLTIAPTLFFIAHQVPCFRVACVPWPIRVTLLARFAVASACLPQLVYWIMLKCILCVPDDPCYLTSFRYLTQDKRSIFHKLVHLLGAIRHEQDPGCCTRATRWLTHPHTPRRQGAGVLVFAILLAFRLRHHAACLPVVRVRMGQLCIRVFRHCTGRMERGQLLCTQLLCWRVVRVTA